MQQLNAQARDILARMHVNIDPRAVVSTLTVATGRTSILQGAIHLTVFAVFLFFALVP